MKKIILLFICMFVEAANAGIIFDGASLDPNGSREATQYIEADDFSLQHNSTVSGAQFWTLESSSSTWDGTVNWYIFSDVAQHPSSTPLFSGTGVNINRVSTGRTFANISGTYNEYSYVFNFNIPINLQENTRYWFGLHLSSDFTYGGIFWEGGSSYGTNAEYAQNGDFNNWLAGDNSLAFNLSGVETSVPEPNSLVLLCLGLVGISFSRKAKIINQS